VLEGSPGDLVSLIPVAGPVGDVTTSGLEYPLSGETLAPGTTRGVSNVFAEAEARVEVATGVLLVIRPGGRA
jgi:thiamine pyrophosphokinase